MKRVTGIGGIFFKAKDPQHTKAWYQQHLGIGDGMFKWRAHDEPGTVGTTVWAPFKAETTYFEPSQSPFMVNYRVADLQSLLAALKAEGVEQVGEMQAHAYGKFAWIMDPDGNKIELWEPIEAPATETEE